MAIYRGVGGAGEANDDATLNAVTEKAQAAATSATNAANSATAASGFADDASGFADDASGFADDASDSATAAAGSASAASDDADDCQRLTLTAEDTQYTLSDGTTTGYSALHYAAKAAASQTGAETAETNAENAQSYAEEWATKAEDSLISTDAGGDGSTDYSSFHHATKASASATSASTSATTATNQASDASKLATNAEDTQYTLSDGTTTGYSALHYNAKAQVAKTDAETAETNASNSASDASKLAVNAEDSQYTLSDGTTTGYSALHYATKASASASAAESAKDAALAAYDSFDDRYLGVKSSAPSVDNDGNALVAGALYFDSTTNKMQLYTGSAWVDAYTTGSSFVTKTGDSMTGNLSFGDDDKAIFGAGGDLQIFHNGTYNSSTIVERGAGGLFIKGTNLLLQSDAGENYFYGTANGNVKLYYNNSAKLTTTSTGVTVTGTVAATSYTGDGSALTGIDALPDQSGQSGNYLTTDGSTASWAALDTDANSTTKGLYEHANTISANYSITSGNNAMSAGAITIDSGVSVTVPSGSTWTIV
jgi:hypothetical protein